jgi:tetratricopeptide (TPR) repeat protein
MSFNKEKAMRNAERYLTQGKITSAIGEYRQIVDQDPRDVNTQNMLGDLYFKVKNSDEAVACYRKVAKYYSSQGFAKKAIALYNKIYRIEPDSIEVSAKLADLYRERGSLAEAKKHYQELAGHYEEKNKPVEALEMWEKIAELDPSNTEIHLKIAESYWKDDRATDAAEAFIEAGKRLSAVSRHESAVAAFSRALEIKELDNEAIEGFVRSQLELGYPEDAAKVLETNIQADPFDKDTNFLLVDCYYEMDDAASAENIIIKMVEREPSNYPKFLDLVAVYLKDDDLDSAVRVISMITEHMLVGGEHEPLYALLEEVLNRNPEHIGALRLVVRYHSWMKNEAELKSVLYRVLEVANLEGSVEDETFALTQLLIPQPHDSVLTKRLHVLRGDNDETLEASEITKEINESESISAEHRSESNGAEAASNSGFHVVAHSESYLNDVEAVSVSGTSEVFDDEDVVEAEIVDELSSDDIHVSSPPQAFESNQTASVQSNGLSAAELVAAKVAEASSAPNHNLADLNGAADDPALTATEELKLEEAVESIHFYIDQGYKGLADKSLREIESEFGSRAEIVALREELGPYSGDSEASKQESSTDDSVEQKAARSEATAPQPQDEVSSEDVTADYQDVYEEGAAGDEETDIKPSPQNEEPAEEYVEPEVVSDIGSEIDAEAVEDKPIAEVQAEKDEDYPGIALEADLSGPTEDDEVIDENSHAEDIVVEESKVYLEDPSEDSEIPETGFVIVSEADTETAVEEQVAEAGDEVQEEVLDEGAEPELAPAEEDASGFSNSFENFRDELGLSEAEAESEDNYENHYYHAVAYKEMGLTEEAIREFQSSVNSVKPNDGTHRFLNCCTLLADCFMEKGMPNLAVMWFKRAFEVKGLSAEEESGLHYELGNALEIGGEIEEAVGEFEKIYATDVDYRDVSERVEKLRQKLPASI